MDDLERDLVALQDALIAAQDKARALGRAQIMDALAGSHVELMIALQSVRTARDIARYGHARFAYPL